MLKSFISVLISICTALLVLILVMPVITAQPAADKAQSSFARLSSISVKSIKRNAKDIVSSVSGIETEDTVAEKLEAEKLFSVENIVDATNQQRITAGLPPLKVNVLLNQSAHVKTKDMIAKQYFEHVSPTGKSVADLGGDVGYQYIIMGENLAMGDFSDATDLLNAWMNSPGHRANILNANYQDLGVYASRAVYQGHEVWFAVQHFGSQRGACPKIDEALRESVKVQNANLKIQEAQIMAMRSQIEGPDHPVGVEYQTLVVQFNDLVKSYNAALATSKKDIAKYNTQVKTFNSCLSKYQKEKKV